MRVRSTKRDTDFEEHDAEEQEFGESEQAEVSVSESEAPAQFFDDSKTVDTDFDLRPKSTGMDRRVFSDVASFTYLPDSFWRMPVLRAGVLLAGFGNYTFGEKGFGFSVPRSGAIPNTVHPEEIPRVVYSEKGNLVDSVQLSLEYVNLRRARGFSEVAPFSEILHGVKASLERGSFDGELHLDSWASKFSERGEEKDSTLAEDLHSSQPRVPKEDEALVKETDTSKEGTNRAYNEVEVGSWFDKYVERDEYEDSALLGDSPWVQPTIPLEKGEVAVSGPDSIDRKTGTVNRSAGGFGLYGFGTRYFGHHTNNPDGRLAVEYWFTKGVERGEFSDSAILEDYLGVQPSIPASGKVEVASEVSFQREVTVPATGEVVLDDVTSSQATVPGDGEVSVGDLLDRGFGEFRFGQSRFGLMCGKLE